jgi:hypothetical protein
MGTVWDFINGMVILALVIALGFTGWEATHRAYFQAVSESYYGRKAQLMGGVCLLLAIAGGMWFLTQLLAGRAGLFYLLGAALGAYLTLRYYLKRI